MAENSDNLQKLLTKIKSDKTEEVIAFVKAGISAIPIPCSGVIAEIFSTVVPNMRAKNTIAFLTEVGKRLSAVEAKILSENPYAVDIFQETAVVASKSLTTVRNCYLAELTKKSVDCDEKKHSVHKEVLYVLAELTDHDIEVLESYLKVGAYETGKKFRSKTTMPLSESVALPEEEQYNYTLALNSYNITIQKLLRMGLLERRAEYYKPSPQDLTHSEGIAFSLSKLQEAQLDADIAHTQLAVFLLTAIGLYKRDNRLHN